jgi:hypothetical protein
MIDYSNIQRDRQNTGLTRIPPFFPSCHSQSEKVGGMGGKAWETCDLPLYFAGGGSAPCLRGCGAVIGSKAVPNEAFAGAQQRFMERSKDGAGGCEAAARRRQARCGVCGICGWVCESDGWLVKDGLSLTYPLPNPKSYRGDILCRPSRLLMISRRRWGRRGTWGMDGLRMTIRSERNFKIQISTL